MLSNHWKGLLVCYFLQSGVLLLEIFWGFLAILRTPLVYIR